MDNYYSIRLITAEDTSEVLSIYAQYVLNTTITFEYYVPSVEEYEKRISTNSEEFPWLVCIRNEKIVGFAYAGKYRARAAYQWSPESSIYLSEDVQGKGIARILYETLFAILTLQGYYNVYAGTVVPNEKSERLHRSLGFEEIGVFKKVGYKHGIWHDTKWFQLRLINREDNPSKPTTLPEVKDSPEFQNLLKIANQKASYISSIYYD